MPHGDGSLLIEGRCLRFHINHQVNNNDQRILLHSNVVITLITAYRYLADSVFACYPFRGKCIPVPATVGNLGLMTAAAWLSGNALVSINVVALRRARLVLTVTVRGYLPFWYLTKATQVYSARPSLHG